MVGTIRKVALLAACVLAGAGGAFVLISILRVWGRQLCFTSDGMPFPPDLGVVVFDTLTLIFALLFVAMCIALAKRMFGR